MSVNQTESPVKESQQEIQQEIPKAEKKPFFTWGLFIKINAVLIAVVAIFGVAVQKGMLDTMGFNDVAANYELKEVYYFAVIGFVEPLNRLISSGWLASWDLVLLMAGMFVIGGWFLHLELRHSKKSVSVSVKQSSNWVENFFKKVFDSRTKTVMLASVVGAAVGSVSTAITKLVLLMPIVIILLPAMAGYSNGSSLVNKMIEEYQPCIVPEFNKAYSTKEKVAICQRHSIKGNVIWGKRVMDTGNAYVIMKGHSFYYTSKKGDECIQEPFVFKNEKGEDVVSFKSSEDVEKACFSVAKNSG